ncbi:MAG: vWA domain-containing protein [Fibrobacterota bacterium]
MTFAAPHAFWLLLLLIPIAFLYVLRERSRRRAIPFSRTAEIRSMAQPLSLGLRHGLLVLRLGGLALLIIALARPREGSTSRVITSRGVDIMLALDVSPSMRGLDFQPDHRLAVAKEELQNFIDNRRHDRIGLTVFGGRAYTKCPLTLDYDILRDFITQVEFEEKEWGTAIGTAIATAANNLKESSAESRIMILLTDGASNRGEIQPREAAKAAATLGIKIYTIAVGKEGRVPYKTVRYNPFVSNGKDTVIEHRESDLDEESLQEIAEISGGEFFRAHSSQELKNIYESINRMEKSEIKTRQWTVWQERFHPWLIWGFVLLLMDFLLSYTRFRRLP